MFRERNFVWLRVIGALILLAGLVAGGYLLFQAGQAQGYALGAASGNNGGAQAAPSAPGAVPAPPYAYGPGYGYGYWRPHAFGFFPFFGGFGCLIPLLFFFLFFGLLRFVFWGHRPWGWRHGYGPGYGPGPGYWHHHHGAPPEGEAQPEQPQEPPAPRQNP